jgi:urease subunit alpha
MGDPNASIPTPQPIIYRNMFGAHGKAKFGTCANFVSQASIDNGTIASYGLEKMILPVKNCRNIGKKDLIHNDKTPLIEVNPENYKVTVDGEYITCEPAEKLPLTQLYYLF